MSGAAYIDKRGWEPGSGLTPDKWQPLGLNIGVPMLKWLLSLRVERSYDEN